MSFLPKSPLVVGIETTNETFKLAFLTKKRGLWQIVGLEEIPLDCQSLDMIPEGATIVTALRENQVLVRPLELPFKAKAKLSLDGVIEFQAEPLLPYTLEKAVLQKCVLTQNKGSTLFTLLSVKKEHLNDHLHFFREKKVESEVVTSPSHALAALCPHLDPELPPMLLMHLDEKEGVVALCENGKLIAARSFENDKYEMQKSVLALLNAHKTKKIDSIYLFADEEISAKIVREATGKNVEIPSFSHAHKGFCLAIGIALSSTHKERPDFRQKEFVYPFKWKKIKKPLTTYFAAAALLLVALFVLEKSSLSNYETALLTQSEPLVGKVDSKEELLAKFEKFESKMATTKEIFALFPSLPKVSDLIASFSKDSQFVNSALEPIIVVDALHYTLVSRPSFEERTKRYLVKVDLLVSAPSPKLAHIFCEYLKSAHPFIDTQKEILWNAENGKYRASFYLKDKTRYH